MNKKKAKSRFIFACLAPAVILVFILMVIPTFEVFKTAFFQKANFVSDATFCGLFNFKTLLADERFIEAMQNTILYVVLITIITLVLAVLFATLLTREEFKGKNFFRVIFYIPNILSIVVIAGIFSAIYAPSNGILNSISGNDWIRRSAAAVDGKSRYNKLCDYRCIGMAGYRVLYGYVYVKYVKYSRELI